MHTTHICIWKHTQHCAVYGREVKAHSAVPFTGGDVGGGGHVDLLGTHPGRNTVTYEARALKALLLELMYR